MDFLFPFQVQAKILEEQLSICKNEANNIISVIRFFLNLRKDQESQEKSQYPEVEECLRRKKVELDIFKNKGEEFLKSLSSSASQLPKERKELINLLVSLETLKVKVDFYLQLLGKLKDFYHIYLPTEVLILFSTLFKEIENTLKTLNVAAKVLKFRRENAYQSYVPIPLLHRRYRLYNLHHFLNFQFGDLLEKFLEKNKWKDYKVDFVFSSDYDVGDLVSSTYPVVLVRGSFFWREQDLLLPLLVHEVAHGLYERLYKRDKKFEKLKKKLEDIAFRYTTSLTRVDLFGIRVLWEDIFADAIAYLCLGDAYFLSLIFGGLFGYKYFTLGISGILAEEGNSLSWEYLPTLLTPIDEIDGKERAIIRILFLRELRKRILGRKRKGRTEKTVMDKAVEGALQALNDLYPLLDSGEGRAYSLLTKDKQVIFNLKASLMKALAGEFIALFEDLKIKKLEMEEHPLVVSWKKEGASLLISEENSKGFLWKLEEKDVSQNNKNGNKDKDEDKEEDKGEGKKKSKDFVIVFSEPGSNYEKSNIYETLWRFNLERIESSSDSSLTLWEGRVFRTFYIMRYPLFKSIFKSIDKNGKSIEILLDELVQLKTREIYENKNENESLLDKIREFKKSFSEVPLYSLGAFDFSFFRRELPHEISGKSAKEDETEFYKKLFNTLSYTDRHSILAFRDKVENLKENKDKKRWRGIILAKIAFDVLEKSKDSLKKDGVWKEEVWNEVKDYLYGISSGWETLVFVIEDSLEKIFDVKRKLSSMPWIKRTETTINVNFEEDAESEVHTNTKQAGNDHKNIAFTFAIHASVRVENLPKDLPPGWYLYPGRHDLLYIEEGLDEGQVFKKLKDFLKDTKKIGKIKDVHIDIIARLKQTIVS